MTGRFGLNESTASALDIQVEAFASSATEPSCSLPSLRHGSQAYFWTTDWQQKERLADWDFLIGETFKPTDVEDLIRHLHGAAGAATD